MKAVICVQVLPWRFKMKKADIVKLYTAKAGKVLKKSKANKIDTSPGDFRNKKAHKALSLYKKLLFINIANENIVEETIQKGDEYRENVVSAIEVSVARKGTIEQFLKDASKASSSFIVSAKNPADAFNKFVFSRQMADGAVKTLKEIISLQNFKIWNKPHQWHKIAVALCFYYSAPFKKIDFIVEQKVDIILSNLIEAVANTYTNETRLQIPNKFKKIEFKESYRANMYERMEMFKKVWSEKIQADTKWLSRRKKTDRVRFILNNLKGTHKVTVKTGLKYLREIEKDLKT